MIRAVQGGEGRVVFDLHRPDGSFESLLQLPVVRAGDAATARELSVDDGAGIVGSGALRVRSLRDGEWVFTRALAREGFPRTLRVVPLRDPNALALRLMHGDGDIAELKPDIVPLFEGRRDFVVRSSPSAGFTYLGTRCDRGPLALPAVRRAVAHAIDRDGLRRARLGATRSPPPGRCRRRTGPTRATFRATPSTPRGRGRCSTPRASRLTLRGHARLVLGSPPNASRCSWRRRSRRCSATWGSRSTFAPRSSGRCWRTSARGASTSRCSPSPTSPTHGA
ncbi:MAG: hypothetical protein IPN17_31090 [Deltaproteobacteria bacterium]|nr:hypothetical protein [Deltaproteobacteria bacterium]